MVLFAVSSVVAAALVLLFAHRSGGRRFAAFGAVLLGFHLPSSIGMFAAMPRAWPLLAAAQASTMVYLASYARPGLRPLPFRLFVSWPASWYVAGTFLAMPWAALTAVGLDPWAPWLPYVVAAAGLAQSVASRRSVVAIQLDGTDVGPIGRAPSGAEPDKRETRPLRVVQITDPHLGPFMSVRRLHEICQRAVDADPDLILLTGDYLTVESNGDVEALTRAFAPLAAARGRVFAIRGNHDLEAPRTVANAMAAHGIRLLIDEVEVVETDAGTVQILGVDFRWRGRAEHLAALHRRHPPIEGATRIVLLHDPSAFRHLPPGGADLVLSGHTHGGQVGLFSLGGAWTPLKWASIPDHGLWGRGTDRLYVHRGTGHYGFPLRVGVPAEESVLELHRST